jgi:hypothetical protein
VFFFQHLIEKARVDPRVEVDRLADEAVFLSISDAGRVAGAQVWVDQRACALIERVARPLLLMVRERNAGLLKS